nr:MAG TPA: hypothetical protein [Caudoviricetes sp.]DAS10666.1 MAG TPA: hypothetical protein [Caudoviricetes sp.]
MMKKHQKHQILYMIFQKMKCYRHGILRLP